MTHKHRAHGGRLMTRGHQAHGVRLAGVVAAAALLAGGWSAVAPAKATGSGGHVSGRTASMGTMSVGTASGRTASVGTASRGPASKGTASGGTASTQPAGTCSVTASGSLSSCPPPVPRGLLPAGAKDQATVTKLVTDPASMVDTRTWTSSGGNTYPGANVPFGMVQWSPDTMPHRSDGGGYTYGNRKLSGYSLTHLSGVGCPAAGDIPILPMTGALPRGNLNTATTSFTNSGEVAEAGYYSARSNGPATITSQFSATAHSAIGRFTFPKTSAADFLIKLRDSEKGDSAASVKIASNTEIEGSATSGNFCKETSSFGPQRYTVYFDITFNRPFASSRVINEPHGNAPNAVFLRFNTTSNRVVDAKVGISYVGVVNARLNRSTELPGWDFAHVEGSAKDTWNELLGRIAVAGGSFANTQEFYSLLYKDFLQPNITSDVNGQYRGSDLRIHKLSPGQTNQYGMFSGWDIYHSLAQLQALLAPAAASDMAQSLVNYYEQNGILQQWGYLNLDNYAMVGDPADAVIADYYAFGATNFNTTQALADMLRQANTVNHVRPGEALEAKYGYLPSDGTYGCCRIHDYASALLEYDTADSALAMFATALGDTTDAGKLQIRANNWVNLFDASNQLLTPRLKSGKFVTGITPTTTKNYVEGDAYEYLWDVPNDYSGLFSLLGGDAKVVPELRRYLSKPDGQGVYAKLANEFDLGEQFAPDYAGDPATAQKAVDVIRNVIYLPGPDGILNNDDLGSESSQYIWEMLGMYPENPGSDNLVFASPGFSQEVISLPNGKTITISAPGASKTRFYVSSLTINGAAYTSTFVPFATLAQGSTLDWTLGTQPTTWGTDPQDAPPSYGPIPTAPPA